jgi:PIN domain nuclease of toxin-antitoxin system/antitoxin (DNA-binding transcriptional repressor) of toxin-antitoxin stability system
MKIVTIHAAKATLSQLVARAEAGEEIILVRVKMPIAKIVPYHAVVPKRQFGALRRGFSVGPGFFEPLPEEELAAWQQQVLNLLLDTHTHTLLWSLLGDMSLSASARDAIGDTSNDVFVSAASAWEITTKVRIGKLPDAGAIAVDLAAAVEAQGFVPMAVSFAHGQMAGALPGPHRDPFDRMLVAQAMADDMVLVSNEQRFDAYGVRRLW